MRGRETLTSVGFTLQRYVDEISPSYLNKIFEDIKLYKGMDELITKAILVASSKDENKEICISLANNLVDKKLKNTLIDILETDDLKSYILGEK